MISRRGYRLHPVPLGHGTFIRLLGQKGKGSRLVLKHVRDPSSPFLSPNGGLTPTQVTLTHTPEGVAPISGGFTKFRVPLGLACTNHSLRRESLKHRRNQTM